MSTHQQAAQSAAAKASHTVETRPLSILVRAKTGNYFTNFPYDITASPLGFTLPEESRHTEYSPNGDLFVSVEGEQCQAVVRNASDPTQTVLTVGGINDTQTPLNIAFATFSPRGTYLLTWARPMNGVNVPNLVIYEVATGQRKGAFHQKTFHLDFWPSIQWSDDESIAARSVTNTIHFFAGDKLDEAPSAKLGIPGIVKFSLSHGPAPYSIAAFLNPGKGAPVKVAMYNHPDQGGEQLSFRSTFRADTVKFQWNAKGTACLALVSTNVDSTGENYYGETFVVYMNNDGSVEQKIDLPKKGPVHDIAWSPTGMEFIIVYGNMPSRATMFNEKCEPVFDFGTGSRNTLCFSPHGRLVALAGFGNLPGDVEFWDKNKLCLVGKAYLPCTTMFSWSGCSRYFLAATTFPRLRVDNVIRVVRFDGKKIHEHAYGTSPLYHVVFRPALRGTYADPKFTMDDMIGGPAVPVDDDGSQTNGGSNGNGNGSGSGSGNGIGSGGGMSGEKKKGGVYRPPASRGAAPTFTLNEKLKAGKVDKASFMASAASVAAGVKSVDEVGSGGSFASRHAPAKKFVPGMDPDLVNKSAGPSKAAIARRKRKERQAAAKAAGNGPSETKVSGGGAGTDSNKEGDDDFDNVEAGEKKLRKLRKKLRKIEELKANQKEGKELSKEQREKLEGEKNVLREVAAVEKKLAQLSTAAN